MREAYPISRENPTAYLYASYFLEPIDASLPEREPQPALFDLLHFALRHLDREEKGLLARYFEVQLLKINGYQPDFQHCVGCGRAIKSGFLSPVQEGITCEDCGGGLALSPKTLYALQFLLNAGEEQLFRLKVDATQMRKWKSRRPLAPIPFGKKSEIP